MISIKGQCSESYGCAVARGSLAAMRIRGSPLNPKATSTRNFLRLGHPNDILAQTGTIKIGYQIDKLLLSSITYMINCVVINGIVFGSEPLVLVWD